jgi:hypothetical protein
MQIEGVLGATKIENGIEKTIGKLLKYAVFFIKNWFFRTLDFYKYTDRTNCLISSQPRVHNNLLFGFGDLIPAQPKEPHFFPNNRILQFYFY